MSRTKDTDILIIGSGFAGTSVASMLPADRYLVVDRGEPFDLASANAALNIKEMPDRPGHFAPRLDATALVCCSAIEGNQITLPLSFMTTNAYSYVQGGNSNWWGANAARVTPDTFERDGVLAWPLGYRDIEPYYRRAELLLRVHGDPTVDDYTVFGPMPGWEYWREYMSDTFPGARVIPQAKNLTDGDSRSLGLCQGNGHCNLCQNDAKARPANIFPAIEVIGRSYIHEIVFEGRQATAVRGRSDGEDFEVTFDRLVLCAGGLENCALLKRSRLPHDVSPMIGRRYQDHTHAEALVLMPKAFERNNLGAEGGMEIPELSGQFGEVGVKTLMWMDAPLEHQLIELARDEYHTGSGLLNVNSDYDRAARFFLQMEVPPEWELELRCNGDDAYIYSLPYLKRIPILDTVALHIFGLLPECGLRVLKVFPYYRSAFGGQHYSGTTPMSRTEGRVVSSEQLLLGTDNVYINGGSVLPRCGGSGPTHSIVALGLRLGEHLANS
jgi:choline dehydrogenase-like flavoprotein